MANHTLKKIIEESFGNFESFVSCVNKEGFPFNYDLMVQDSEYPCEFSERDKENLGKSLTELITNALKSVFGISNLFDIFEKDFSELNYGLEGASVNVGLEMSNEEYKLSVVDNGPGISNENLLKIWDCGFSTCKTNGIGLSSSKKRIEEEYHGRIEVQSEPKIRTEFSVYIPIGSQRLRGSTPSINE